jgi:toxin-antitoxin system PIN domain toxin
VVLVDANLLVYAYAEGAAEHDAASRWLDAQLSGRTRVGLPWEALLAFIRLVTNPRVFERPASIRAAWQQVESWLAVPRAWVPRATDRHQDVLRPLMNSISKSALVPDAHLAALAIEHGLVLASSDGDFARFPGLRWENPLAGA